MSRFNVGDKVFLSPTSDWVNDGSNEADSTNPLNVEGAITHVFYGSYRIKWSNEQINSCYTDDDLIPSVAKQPEQECPHAIIEELYAQIENLEELVSEQAARIRVLEADYVQEQAACYLRLNNLLQKHESFQESNKCRSDELADTIEVLQDAYDRLPNRFR